VATVEKNARGVDPGILEEDRLVDELAKGRSMDKVIRT
jgi:hypothetical protein